MHNLSTTQILSLWTELEEARAGTNGYGSNVAEIYIYRAMPGEPDAKAVLAMSEKRAAETNRAASESLLFLFQTFAEMRRASVGVEDEKPREFRPIGPWFVERDFRHRVHVQVIKKTKWKWGIMHPSDRALGPNFDGKEVWGADEPLLFDTREDAQAHAAKRLEQFPNSDWSQARVLRCKPGRKRVYPEWEWTAAPDLSVDGGER